jgi:RNA polymerase sigma-70 factor (ECF subfamily)
VRAWLFSIVYNLHVSGRRRRARRSRLLGEALHFQEAATPPLGQDTAVQCAEVLLQLDTLPEEQRAVLLLVGVEGLSYEEAARVLDIPPGTVMSRLARGRERLRRMAEGQPVPRLRRVV